MISFGSLASVRNDSQHGYGVHGYDNDLESMQAIFMALGPMFNSGGVMEEFDNIDLYPLFCTMLDISCPPSEGTDRPKNWNILLKGGLET